jgi:hypothetical protein
LSIEENGVEIIELVDEYTGEVVDCPRLSAAGIADLKLWLDQHPDVGADTETEETADVAV